MASRTVPMDVALILADCRHVTIGQGFRIAQAAARGDDTFTVTIAADLAAWLDDLLARARA